MSAADGAHGGRGALAEMRWEAGKVAAARAWTPRLLAAATRRRDARLAATALQISSRRKPSSPSRTGRLRYSPSSVACSDGASPGACGCGRAGCLHRRRAAARARGRVRCGSGYCRHRGSSSARQPSRCGSRSAEARQTGSARGGTIPSVRPLTLNRDDADPAAATSHHRRGALRRLARVRRPSGAVPAGSGRPALAGGRDRVGVRCAGRAPRRSDRADRARPVRAPEPVRHRGR